MTSQQEQTSNEISQSDSSSGNSLPAEPPVHNTRRVRLIGGLCMLFLVIGAVWLGYWVLFLRQAESTDDAYVAGNLVRISPQVTGNIKEIFVDNTQSVKAGQLLAVIDPTDASLALERSRDSLAEAVRQARSLMVESDRLKAVIELRKTELERAQGDYDRRKNRKTSLAVSMEELSHSEDSVALAQAALLVARHAWQANRMLVQDTPLQEQPLVRLRAHEMREAWLALKRCEIKSPADGYVARRSVQVGARVAPGDPLMAIVPLAEVWVDANFKEVQIERMRIGQPVTVHSDLYGSSVTYTGTVAGFSAGTGSSFSLLPPENATGNWIKVVQRVPVKIVLDKAALQKAPLLVGLSCAVHVDVSNTEGRMLAPVSSSGPLFRTDVLTHDLTDCNREIEAIITANATAGTPEAAVQ